MATQLFLLDTVADTHLATNNNNLIPTAVGWTSRALGIARGSGVVASTSTATVTGTTLGVVVQVGGVAAEWISPPVSADVTISGTITANIWARESANAANAAINVQIEIIRANALGTANSNTLVTIVKSTRVTELGASATTNTAQSFTTGMASGGYTSQTLNRGDRLRVLVFADDAGTMGSGQTFTIGYNGTTAAANGDTYINFTENFGFEVGAGVVQQAQRNSSSTVGINTSQEFAQPFVAVGNLTEVRAWLSKVTSPNDDLVLQVQTDNAGEPSGTVVGTVTTVPNIALTATATEYTFACSISLTPNTTYWLVATRSGSLNETNYYQVGIISNLQTGWTSSERYDGTADTWVSLGWTMAVRLTYATSTLYLTNAHSGLANTPALISSFTGSDESPLSEGGNWAELDAGASSVALQRVSNAVASSLGAGHSYWTPANFGPDVEAYLTVTTISAATFGITARIQGEGGTTTWDGYLVYGTSSGTTVISRATNAVLTTVLAVSTTWTDGDKIGIRIQGSTIQAWRQASGSGTWNLVSSAVDTTYASAGKIGIYATNGVTRLDDFHAATNSNLFTQKAWTSRGAGVVSYRSDTDAGWLAPLYQTDWYTPQLSAFTLAGMVLANVRALEDTSATNASLRCEIARVESDGTSPTVWGNWCIAPIAADGGELTTAETARAVYVSGDNLAISNGQRLRLRMYSDDPSSVAMTAGADTQIFYNGTTAAASGDTYITLPQAVSEYGAPSGTTYEKAGFAISTFNCDVYFGRTPVLDTFTGANETPITTNWTTPMYTGESSGPDRWGNQMDFTVGSAYYDIATLGPDVEAYATVATKWTFGHAELRVRAQGVGGSSASASYYFARWWQDNTYVLGKTVNGTQTDLATGTRSFATGDKFGIAVVGDKLSFGHYAGGAWTVFATAVDTSITQAGRVGVESDDGGADLDDFGGGVPVNHGAKSVFRQHTKTGIATSHFNCDVHFGRTAVLDTFSGTLGSWTNPIFGGTAVVIATGQLAGTAGGDNAAAWTANFASDDQEIYYDVPTDTNNLVSLFFLIQDTDATPTTYAIDVTQVADAVRIRRFNNGVLTTLGTTTLALAAGDSIGASKVGSLISFWRKPSAGSWTLITSVTDPAPLTGGGKVGLNIEGSAMRVDNFGGGAPVNRGDSQVTYVESGTAIIPRVASGADATTYAQQNIAIKPHVASGDAATTFAQSNVAISERRVSGTATKAIISTKTGIAISRHQTYPTTFTTSVLDNFNRANENPLANGTWNTFHPGVGNNQIISSKIAPSAGTYSGSYWTPTTFGSDQECYFTIDTKWAAAGPSAELHIRLQNPGGGALDAYILRAFNNGSNEVITIDRQIDTNDINIASVSATITNGDKVGIRVLGNTIYGYHFTGGSWNQVLRVDDFAITGAGYVGFGSSNAAGTVLRLDDMGGGTVVVSYAGTNAITYSETGTAISERVASGTASVVAVITYTKTGTAKSHFNCDVHFGRTPVLDDFNRADNASSLGANWTAFPESGYASMGVISNQAYAASAWKGNYWTAATYGSDHEVWATIAVLPVYRFAIYVRLQNPGGSTTNAYKFEVHNTGVSYITKHVNDVSTWVGNGPTIAAGDSIGLRVTKNRLEMWRKTSGGSWTFGDKAYEFSVTGPGYIGMHVGDETTVRVDNFGGGISVNYGAKSVTRQKAGTAIADRTASGDAATTFVETGLGRIDDFDVSGTATKTGGVTNTETGQATTDFTGTGADATTFAETGAAVTDRIAVGDSSVTQQNTGAAISDRVASGPSASTHAEAGTAVLVRVASGADSITPVEAGTAVMPRAASGADALTFVEAGTAISPHASSGADQSTFVQAHIAIAEFIASAAKVRERPRTGISHLVFAASGADATAYAQANTGIVVFTGTGIALLPYWLRPDADLSTGTWHDAPLYAKVDEPVANTGDFITSGDSPASPDIAELRLSDAFDPVRNDYHTVRYQIGKDVAGGDSLNFTIRLMQGGTQIAAWTRPAPDSPTIYEESLTEAEAGNITDYTDLRVKIEAVKM